MFDKPGVLCMSLAACMVAGCSRTRPAVQQVAIDSQPKISVLTEDDKKRLRDQRAVVERYLRDEDSKRKYRTAPGKLGTIRAVLKAGALKPEQTYELRCLGTVLGDAFVQELGMEWVIAEDEHGRDPAVRLPGTSILAFPLTMISKRMERGDTVDVFDLFNGVAAQVEKLKREDN
jgi:Domain of unknown function (DUF3806)